MKIKLVNHLLLLAVAITIFIPILSQFLPQSASAASSTSYYYVAWNEDEYFGGGPYSVEICTTPKADENAECWYPNSLGTYKTGYSSPNQYVFSDSPPPNPGDALITVNTCSSNDSQAVLENAVADKQGSYDPQSITIQNYQSALSAFNKDDSGGDYTWPLSCKTPKKSSTYTVTLLANILQNQLAFTYDQTNSASVGPVTFEMCSSSDTKCSSSNALQTVNSNTLTGPNATSSDLQLTASLKTAPGTYYFCVTGINAPCQEVDIASDQTVTFSGEADASIVSSTGGCSSDSSNCGPTCESSDWSLSWIACSVINEMEDIEFYAKTALNDLLKTPIITFTGKYCGSSSSSVPAINKATSCIYKVWSNMRLYADVILLLAFLVVVYSEAVGGGVMDAYTVKKMLPRILLAAILINLSIYLVAAALDITNILGAGLYDVLRAPFSSSGTWVINLNGIGGSVIGGSTLSLLLGGGALAISSIIDPSIGGAVLDAAIGMLFLVGVPVILAILSVILTLIVRTALLYFLIMISPIAFALFCLPNTERVFKSWWKHLAQTLLVYPILAVVFAMAGIIGVIMSAIGLSSGTIGWFGELISAVAVVSPLFLIPFSFKIAGGAMGQVSDAVTNLRGRAQGALFGDERDPNSNRNRFRRRLQADRSELGLTGGQIGAMANPFGGGLRARRNAVRSRRIADRTRHGAETVENDAIWQANRTNEKFLQAHANRELAVESMEAARNAGDTATASAWDQSIAAADQVHRNKATMMASANAWAATGFEHKMGPQGYNDLAKTISRITGTELQYDQHGNVVGARAGQATAGDYGLAMNNAQFALRQAGRYDLGGINNGKGYDLGLGLSKTSGYTAGNAKTEVFQAGALRYLGASGDQQSISDAISAKLRVSAQNNDAYAMKSADDDIRKWHAQLLDAYASPTQGNKEEILKQLRAIQDPSSRLSHETIAELQHNYNMYINRRPGVDPNQIETP